MDDDVSAGVMQMPDGTGLYLSTAAKAGHNGAKGFMKSQLNNWGIRIHKIIFKNFKLITFTLFQIVTGIGFYLSAAKAGHIGANPFMESDFYF